jgi:hypothetical protein
MRAPFPLAPLCVIGFLLKGRMLIRSCCGRSKYLLTSTGRKKSSGELRTALDNQEVAKISYREAVK